MLILKYLFPFKILSLACCALIFLFFSFTSTAAVSDENIRIATFNIKSFGKSKISKPSVMGPIVNIVKKYDIVAIQEIKDKREKVPDQFLAMLGRGWAMSESPRTGKNPDDQHSQEQYVFYYQKKVISEEGSGALYPDTNDYFQREPWLARFRVQQGNFTFVIINIHTRPESAVEEINALHKVVIWARKHWPDEDDFIVLGDFNASCSYASKKEISNSPLSGSDYFWIVPDSANTNLSSKKCAYDRIVISKKTKEQYTGSWGVDQVFTDKKISDHWPVWAEFYRGRDDGAKTPKDTIKIKPVKGYNLKSENSKRF